jgi:lysophospholipase L1-like esterase
MKQTLSRRLSGPLANILLLCSALVVAVLLAEVITRLAKPGFPGFRLPQVQHRPVAGLGFEMVPLQTAYTWASPVRVNSLGFRGPEIRTPSGDPLVFCIGDSMTFGNGVEEADTYAHQLERLLARQQPGTHPETINMGVQRYSTFQEIDLLRLHAPRLRPSVVTLAVYVNDLGVRPAGHFVREYEKEREQAATALRNVAPSLYLFSKNIATVELFKQAYLAWRVAPGTPQENALAGTITPRDEPRWQGLERELVTFRELSGTYGFRPLVVFVPARAQVQTDFPQSAYPRRLVEHSRRNGLVAIDPTEAFKRELRAGNDPYLPWDDHMSPTGHRLIAEALVGQIQQHPPVALGLKTEGPNLRQ